jgi:signal transduction histidine kinase
LATFDFLAGGGQMGAMMRGTDWAATPLGPLDAWPQSLRTTVSTCLNSRFPIFIWWGRELVSLYNDAYREILADKHPRSLAQRAPECWAEIWDVIGPMVDSVFVTGEPTWSENQLLLLERSGFLEETYFTFSYGAIRDESNAVGGIFATVHETTRQVLGERRLRTLRDLASRTADATSVADVVRLASEVLAENPRDLPAARIAESGEVRPGELAFSAGRMVLFVTPSSHLRLAGDYESFLALLGGQVATAVERVRALQEARERAEALAEIDRAKTAFFSNVSHEFRTPLTLLLGPIEQALETRAPLAGADLDTAHRNALRLLKLVNALLDFSRIEAGRAQVWFEPVELGKLTADLASAFRSAIENAGLVLDVRCERLGEPVYVDRDLWEKVVLNLLSNVDDLLDVSRITSGRIELRKRRVELFEIVHRGLELASPLLEARRNRIEVDVPRTGLVIDGDLDWLAQIVSNLLTNAAKYSNLETRIAVTATVAGGSIRLAVRDEGVGIAPEMLDRVFDLFVQQLHGGSIRAFSAGAGTGSEFVVALPAAEGTLARDPSGRTSPLSHLQRRVLVVDDNDDALVMLRGVLEELGCTVEVAHDGPTALDKARDFRPEIALLDIGLPVMDGYELARRMRELSRMHLVAITGYGTDSDRARAHAAGFARHLVKPVDMGDLLSIVRELN